MATTTVSSRNNGQIPDPIIGKSGYEILNTTYKPPVWIVPEILPAGLTILSGRPKLGKSWMILQICRAVAEGSMLFGKQMQEGRALYIALEDNEEQLKERMKQQGWTNETSKYVTFFTPDTFRKYIGALHKKGWQNLKLIVEQEGYSFAAIDTYSRAFPGLKDPYDSQEATAVLSPLQELSISSNFSLTFADHQRKANIQNPDPIDDIFGATGKGAVVDTGIGLYKNYGDATFRLMGAGRRIKRFDLTLEFNSQNACWNVMGKTSQHVTNSLDQEIIDTLTMLGNATFTEIHNAIGKDKGYISRRLKDLVDRAIVISNGIGKGMLYSYIGNMP